MKILQLYAVISGILLIYYGTMYKDYIILMAGLVTVYRDYVLLFREEDCIITDKPIYDLSIRSGNKIIQLMATIVGFYIICKYPDNILLLLLGIIIFIGDGYLFLFEKDKIC